MSLSKSPQSFSPRTEEQNIKSFADLMPLNKKLWAATRISQANAYRLLKVLAEELARFQFLEYEIASKYIPNFDDSFIESWEQMLGIPDSCFSNSVSDEERRRNIIIKLAYLNLQTANDYVILGDLLNLNVQVLPNVPTDPFIWTINIDSSDPNVFPYTFPITFSENFIGLYECLVQKQKPAHTQVLFSFSGNAYSTNSGDIYTTNSGNPYVNGGTF